MSAYEQFLALAKPHTLRVGPPPSPSPDEEEIRRAFGDLVQRELAADDDGFHSETLFRLRKLIETTIHLGKKHEKHWQLLYTTADAAAGLRRVRTFADAQAWARVLDAAVDVLNRTSFRHAAIGGSREQVLANGLQALERRGYRYRIDDFGARLSETSLQRVSASIERKIARAGGLHTANAMLNLMGRLGRIEDGSLLHARLPTMTGCSKRSAGTPWHYIYNLSLKRFDARPTTKDAARVLTEMEELASNLAAVLDVEPHSSYENMTISSAGIERLIRETTVYDELFGMAQWQPKSAATLIPTWLAALEEAGCAFPLLSREQWISIASSLMTKSQFGSIEPVSARELQTGNLSASQCSEALALLSVPTERLNATYATPFDTGARTSSGFPTIRTADGHHFVQPTAVAARAFCERIYAMMRDVDEPNIENKYGKALEATVAKLFYSAGWMPSVIGEKYLGDRKGEVCEADIILETEDRIYLIECKKKPLTSAARGGGTLAALRDLDGSFFKLVQQLSGHEARLRSRGAITFNIGKTVELRGRHIEKIGVGLFDHGSLQNRDFTIALIKVLAGARLASAHPEAQEVIASLNKHIARINRSLNEIYASNALLPDDLLHRFAMSTWWLSVDQLAYVLIKGDGNLWKGLRDIRHITARSGDLVYEMKRSLMLNEVGKAMLEFAQSNDSRAMV